MLDLETKFGARAEKRLRDDLIGWLSTIRPDGVPVTIPVWFLWDGSTILVYSQPNTGKLRNIAFSPKVSLHLNSGAHGGDIVMVTGEAAVDEAAPKAVEVPAYIEKYRHDIELLGTDPEPFAGQYCVAIRVTPTRISGF
jgi:PPOX class probable F420-dependent enzyme